MQKQSLALAILGAMSVYGTVVLAGEVTIYGVADVGLVLAFLMFLQMFTKSAGLVKGLLAPILAPILPSSMFMMFLVFGLFSVLAFYRGPLTIWGAGTALFVIVAEATGWPIEILYPLFYIPCCTINTNVCPTQSWNMWAIGLLRVVPA